ncbi:TonB-linked SusC/RagA family outer membrane protein [Parabacteroides sp. PFB2-12]|uniref:SusC/RagA family TonB-linked outer membrane protein n=1 Tax=unclassified Parabacteroides TaxID=2649774 RepID=UPI00247441A5|nr:MULTISPECIES: SusC/RagA family TonB-linked outer membrane protein [unclassified Parabacteroides]MDH6344151.1 TonB-linked SusC/RagA family outer membrane protein [Parabacteroides sp. PM6-13]MDH6392024.1 TonB-linked SusC/RagA family outer membrane protein [Parabacteroides sp. PFB2-12]
MKHIYKGLVFCAMFTFCSVYAVSQEPLQEISGDTEESKVQVAFRDIDQEDLLGGVSTIDVKELTNKAYTTYSLDFLENVVGGMNGNLWGLGSYLVVVDGMVRDANNVIPTEIDQITLLKGPAAVVLYGSRAANGVLQITTKRGRLGDIRIDVRANTGMATPKAYPKYLGSAEYMTLYNEARVNDGLTPSYSVEDIYHHASGENPYRYPDLDMYSSDYLRKMYNRSEGIAEIYGGNERVKYYTTTGYYRESSLLKVGNAKDNYISRFFVRGNLDIKLHELITAQADANVTFYDSFSAAGNWWSNAATLRPNRVSPLIPLSFLEENDIPSWNTINASNNIIGGKYFLGGTQLDPTNPIADAYAAGDSKFVSRQFQFNTRFDVNLKPLLEGLFFRAKYGIDYASTYNQGYSNDYATFEPVWSNYAGTDMIASVTQYGNDSKSGNENIDNSAYRYTYNVSAQFDYSKTINADHNLFAMFIGNIWQTQRNGEYHRLSNANLGLQASYNYQQKYYVDFSAAMPYSAKLPEGNRAGFSPTLTLGWRPVKESFFDNTPFDDLMVNVSAGIISQDIDITGGDSQGYYLYKSIMQRGGWYSWGDLGGESATEFQRGDNMKMTFVKRKEITAGLRGSLWNKLISFDFNYFTGKIDGGLARPTSLYPIYFTQTGYPTSSIIPYVNYNIDKRSGFDFSVYANKKVSEVDLTLGVSGMYYTDEAERRDENYAYDYQTRIGQPLNAIWGLENLGFFNSPEEIANSPKQFGELKPGDIKYKDQNGDGVIDSNDEVFLERAGTPFRMGVNLTAKWRNFTLFAMGNGYFGGHGLKSSSYYWVHSSRKYSEIVRDRWTEETKATATYPRLTTTNGENNFRSSDFWLYDSSRFTLAQVQLTYDLPEHLLQNGVVKGLSIYLSGHNLLTIAKERKHLEMNVGSAPQTRFYNLGVTCSF